MFGITRIHIRNERWNVNNDWRLRLAADHEPIVNEIYRNVFQDLADGVEVLEIERDEAVALYDYKEGVDAILTMRDGMRMSVQEKVLTFSKSTVTFEENKQSGVPGAWYYCTAQLYFVGYSRHYKESKIPGIQDWILIDYNALRLFDLSCPLEWRFNKNKNDRRTNGFRFIHFDQVPENCVVSRMGYATHLRF